MAVKHPAAIVFELQNVGSKLKVDEDEGDDDDDDGVKSFMFIIIL